MAKRDQTIDQPLTPNEILRNRKDTISNIIYNLPKIIGKTDTQKDIIRSFKDKAVNIVLGKAGSGKTHISVGFGLGQLKKQTSKIDKIILIKSLTPIKGQEVGFLKGTLEEKIEPYMSSYYDKLDDMVSNITRKRLIQDGFIIPKVMTFERGGQWDNAFILVDECQNFTLSQMKTILTRIGQNSNMVIMGDDGQIDLKDEKSSCVFGLKEMFRDDELVGLFNIPDTDKNFRNPIIDHFEEKFKNYGRLQDDYLEENSGSKRMNLHG